MNLKEILEERLNKLVEAQDLALENGQYESAVALNNAIVDISDTLTKIEDHFPVHYVSILDP